MPLYLDIAVPVPLRRSFTYLPPAGTDASTLQPGIRIEVPFGRQRLVGILMATTRHSKVQADKIKPAGRLIDHRPVLNKTILRICCWAADYYQHPIGDVLHTALPVLLRQGESTAQMQERLVANITDPNQANLKRSPRQLLLLQSLIASTKGFIRPELRQKAFTNQIIRGLIDKGYAKWTKTESLSLPFDKTQVIRGAPMVLTAEQSSALNAVNEVGTHLLFGITGSGKTEIYLQAIERILRQGKQALVLVPEIGLTPQTIARFRSRFRVAVYALHSALTDRQRLAVWRQGYLGEAAVIIGTRSSIFTPMSSPGLIVVDEEHDVSFKQQEGFRYSARDLAVLRGQIEAIPVLLGSATPSLESYHNAVSGKYKLTTLKNRPNLAKTATYKLIGTQHQELQDGFSTPLIHLMKKHLDDGNQILVFLNRRGFSPVILCRQCGWTAECDRCDARMTYHISLAKVICHHCGAQAPVHRVCSKCGSDQLIPLGLGTQRLERALNDLFPGRRIIRIDRDSTRRKDAMEKIVTNINRGESAILVGTQLLAKGHHFPNVTLVAIVDIDSGFYSADYRAIERMGQLLLQVGGRAGRESKPGTVAIQTHFPEQAILKTIIDDGYSVFAEQQLAERLKYQLPPFTHQAIIRAEAINKDLAMQFLSELSQCTSPLPPVTMLGPIPSVMEKRAGRHRAQLLFTSHDRRALQSTLTQCVRLAEQSKMGRKVKWSVDVDPIDLF